MVVGWQTSRRPDTNLVIDALTMAKAQGYVAGGAIFHSDRGAQYTSSALADCARASDLVLSKGRTGVCWDNAVAESFFATLKKQAWYTKQFDSIDIARYRISNFIQVRYNTLRPHSSIGDMPPKHAMDAFMARMATATADPADAAA